MGGAIVTHPRASSRGHGILCSLRAFTRYTDARAVDVLPTRPFRFPALAIAAALAAGCAATPKKIYTPDEMRAELATRVSTQMRDEIVIPFEIDDEIQKLAQDVTRNAQSDTERVEAIIGAITSLSGFSISYDWLSNKTAKEVFRQGKGNCLAYTNLFVGMARSVGVDAVYADVLFTERLQREAEIVVKSTHITGAVTLAGGLTLIDFTKTPERKYTAFRPIDDLEAIANFYNNQGFLYGYFTEKGDVPFDPLEKELEMYRLALEILPTFERARNNLGVALRRRGQIDQAIEQYKLAIQHDPKYVEAHSNLATAYSYQGRTQEALKEYRLAAENAGPDGYVHERLGATFLRLGRYQDAIKEFRTALSKEPDLVDSRYHLGECYRILGDEKKALEEYRAALEIDPNYVAAQTRLQQLSEAGAAPR
jgi:tetratricopeptide (TPR) repeat protein